MLAITREQVRAALNALGIGRTPGAAKRYAQSLLARYGDGAPDIEHLAPAYFGAVFAAAGGNIAPVHPSPQVFRHGGRRIRPSTALVPELERRLREEPKESAPEMAREFRQSAAGRRAAEGLMMTVHGQIYRRPVAPSGPKFGSARGCRAQATAASGGTDMTAAQSPMLTAALAYGRARLKIFPILEMTKDNPLVKWGTRATSDVEQIAAWWKKWPHANIGCATGPSGLAVIDTDNKPDGNGEDTLRALPALVPTRMARTGGGGIHRLYWDEFGEVGNTAGKIGPHVDTRGVGGYVVLPPSRTPTGRYVWLNHAELARIDAWIIEACAASKVDPAPQNPLVEWDLPANVEWARYWLANDAPVSIEGQGGDDTIVKRVVPILKDHAISEETAGELMADVWNDRCQPPWLLGDSDARNNLYTKIHNAYLYCRDRQPGIDTPQADFAAVPAPTDDEMKQLAAWWEEHDAPRREKRLRRVRAYLNWRRQFPATARISIMRRGR